jgi:hypothetical protein
MHAKPDFPLRVFLRRLLREQGEEAMSNGPGRTVPMPLEKREVAGSGAKAMHWNLKDS